MKCMIMWLAVAGLAMAITAEAQIAVGLRAEKETFLLYEPIPLVVSLRNTTGRMIELSATDATPWLSFLVTDEHGSQVSPVGKFVTNERVLIPPVQQVQRTIDVLPLYALRSRGGYSIQARVNYQGFQAISPPVKITIVTGRTLWSETIALPVRPKGEDAYRTYSLIARRDAKEDLLHIAVEEKPKQLVHGLISVGGFLPLFPPVAELDREGHLHVLYQGGPHAFVYLHVDPSARIQTRAVYSDRLSRPRLVNQAGRVEVVGGEQTEPQRDRLLSDEELNPPVTEPEPPPSPAPKKKWWWPFGPATPASNQ